VISIIPYIGGKHRIAKQIAVHLHATDADDDADICKMFRSFRQVRVLTKYSSGNSRTAADTRSKERSELLIHNLG